MHLVSYYGYVYMMQSFVGKTLKFMGLALIHENQENFSFDNFPLNGTQWNKHIILINCTQNDCIL